MQISEIVKKDSLDRQDIIRLLSVTSSEEIESLRCAAESACLKYRGNKVYFRGLIEFSNICNCNCYYCGIRKDNREFKRYLLSKDDIINAAIWCADQNYGSVVLQSGERTDPAFIDFVEDIISTIKIKTKSEKLPEGLGITLCVGEQSEGTYKRFFLAGAHRYLLRIESCTQKVFGNIHPPDQLLQKRIDCLKILKEIGYKLGTGVMIGLPGQTIENLADDILFYKSVDADMIGMGPYIVHKQTPMAIHEDEIKKQSDAIFSMALKMIAVTRLVLKNVNIAATTALQSMKPDGREQGIQFGANVIMPQLTPTEVRKEYLLYEGKPCLDENAEQCKTCLSMRMTSVGRVIGYNEWGDRS